MAFGAIFGDSVAGANRLVLFVASIPFTAFGAWATFGRTGKEIDRESGTVTTWRRVIVPLSRTRHQLSKYSQVVIREARDSDEGTTLYVVELGGGKDEFELGYGEDFHAARQLAEEVAKVCEFDVADRTGDGVIVRKHDELDDSLRQKAQRQARPPAQVERPKTMKADVQWNHNSFVAEFPLRPGGLSLPIFFVGVWIAFYVVADNGNAKKDGGLAVMLLGSFLAVLLTIVLGWIRRMLGLTGRLRVTANNDQLQVEQIGLLWRRQKAIPVDQLEELVLIQPQLRGFITAAPSGVRAWLFQSGLGCSISARSDAQTLEIAGDVPCEELADIHSQLTKVLTS